MRVTSLDFSPFCEPTFLVSTSFVANKCNTYGCPAVKKELL